MKRIAVLVLVGLMAVATGAFALKSTPDFGIGVEVTDLNFVTVGAMMNVHFAGVPLYFGFGANLLNAFTGGVELATTVDLWLLHNPIGNGFVSWYIGLGLYGALGFTPTGYALGLRLPIGLQVWPLNNESMEVFLELGPAWVPFASANQPVPFPQSQLAIGVRFWSERSK